MTSSRPVSQIDLNHSPKKTRLAQEVCKPGLRRRNGSQVYAKKVPSRRKKKPGAAVKNAAAPGGRLEVDVYEDRVFNGPLGVIPAELWAATAILSLRPT